MNSMTSDYGFNIYYKNIIFSIYLYFLCNACMDLLLNSNSAYKSAELCYLGKFASSLTLSSFAYHHNREYNSIITLFAEIN